MRRLPGLARIGRAFGGFGQGAGGYESSRQLAKWLPIGGAIGLVAGGGAILFTRAIELVTHFVLGGRRGFGRPAPLGRERRRSCLPCTRGSCHS